MHVRPAADEFGFSKSVVAVLGWAREANGSIVPILQQTL